MEELRDRGCSVTKSSDVDCRREANTRKTDVEEHAPTTTHTYPQMKARNPHTQPNVHHAASYWQLQQSLSLSTFFFGRVKVSSQTSKTDVEEQVANGDELLKCFSPLLGSMRFFGLYFTRASSRIHEASAGESKVPRKWNGGHVCAAVVCAVLWLNAVRYLTMFESADRFGLALLMKLSLVSSVFLAAVLQTACFVACHSGNLDRVFRDARLPKSNCIRYRRWAIVFTIVTWSFIVAEMLNYVVPMFLIDSYWGLWLTSFDVHFTASGPQLVVLRLVAFLVYLFVYSAWIFSQSVNFIHSKVLQCIG